MKVFKHYEKYIDMKTYEIVIRTCANTDCKNKVSGDSRKKYCSRRCISHNYYLKNRNKIINNTKKWQIDNPEKAAEYKKKSVKKFLEDGRMKKLMKSGYERNKRKWNCRTTTNHIINGTSSYKHLYIPKVCKKCGVETNLQIHHEIYPSSAREIRQALREGKIYYVCKIHHQEETNRKE